MARNDYYLNAIKLYTASGEEGNRKERKRKRYTDTDRDKERETDRARKTDKLKWLVSKKTLLEDLTKTSFILFISFLSSFLSTDLFTVSL